MLAEGISDSMVESYLLTGVADTEVTSPSIIVKHCQPRSNEVPNPLPKRSGVLRAKQGLMNSSVVELLRSEARSAAGVDATGARNSRIRSSAVISLVASSSDD